MSEHAYKNEKLTGLRAQTFYPLLDPQSREDLDKLCSYYHFSYQEFRQLAEASRDLSMWREGTLAEHWERIESDCEASLGGPERKKRLFSRFSEFVRELRERPKRYSDHTEESRPKRPFNLLTEDSDKPVLGSCPVASEKTVCCNLRTLDAVESCAYGCSYCTIQTFYGDNIVFRKNLKQKLEEIELDPNRLYHIGTGQSSDSLVWGNRDGLLDDLCAFAERNPNLLLEFKTKSANTAYFQQNETPCNIVCSWSLNTNPIIDSEEHFTASLAQRLKAARTACDAGVNVAFHFHPIVHYEGWKTDYVSLAERVLDMFSSEEVLFLSFGSVTFIKPVIKEIRRRGGASKILQMPMTTDPHGKLTYPDEIKCELFSTMNEAFSPWGDRVFKYLCMERAYFWDKVFGWHYDSNDAFELDFAARAMEKARRRKRAADEKRTQSTL